VHTTKTASFLVVFVSLPLMAWANPPWERPTAAPHVFKPYVAVRAPDGRADLHEAAGARAALRPPQESAVQRPQARPAASPLPLKSEVQVRARPSDEHDDALKPSLQPSQRPAPAVAARAPKLPIKEDVTVKVMGEAGADSAGSPSQKVAPSSTTGDKSAQKLHVPQTREEIQSFKRHTCINLPFGAHGSDDVQDKTE